MQAETAEVTRDEGGGFNLSTFGSRIVKKKKKVPLGRFEISIESIISPESIILLFKDRHIHQPQLSFTFNGDPLCVWSDSRTMPNQQYFLHAQGCPWASLFPAVVC